MSDEERERLSISLDRFQFHFHRTGVHLTFSFISWSAMLVRVSLLLLVSLAASTEALSEDLCQKACTVSDSLCWFCSLFFDNSTSSLESDSNPRAPTVPELVEKAKVLFRQQKIVGGRALEYGDAPWTAR